MEEIRKPKPHEQKYFNQSVVNLSKNKNISSVNKTYILGFIRQHCEISDGTPLSYSRRTRYIHHLTKFSEFSGIKDFKKAKREDIENFVIKLNNGEITQRRHRVNMPYSLKTIGDTLGAIKTFYKYLEGDGYTFPKKVAWIKKKTKFLDPQSLTESQVEKLKAGLGTIRNRFMVLVLGCDLGLRPNEAMNLRRRDINKKITSDGNEVYKFHVTVSKTKPRTISTRLFPQMVDLFLDEYDRKNRDPNMFIFDCSQPAYSAIFKRAGESILNIKNLTPTLCRHTSVTTYAILGLSSSQLSYRYGHTFNSDVINHYLSRIGRLDDEGGEKIDASKSVKRDNENDDLKRKIDILQDQMKNVRQDIMADMERMFSKVIEDGKYSSSAHNPND